MLMSRFFIDEVYVTSSKRGVLAIVNLGNPIKNGMLKIRSR